MWLVKMSNGWPQPTQTWGLKCDICSFTNDGLMGAVKELIIGTPGVERWLKHHLSVYREPCTYVYVKIGAVFYLSSLEGHIDLCSHKCPSLTSLHVPFLLYITLHACDSVSSAWPPSVPLRPRILERRLNWCNVISPHILGVLLCSIVLMIAM